jgi:LacI family transcriptional regulator
VTVTIKDVARAAGVSPATVSRVFNDTVPVDEETRARVIAAAETLRYVPNAAARSLITSRTGTIGVLLPDLHGAFHTQVMRGLDSAARRRGFDLLVSSAQGDHEAATAALRAMRGRVDGVILMLPELEAGALLRELPDDQPVVLLGLAHHATTSRAVAVDEAGGAAAMVRHLIRHGHRRIALLTGDPRRLDVRERQRGYRRALADAGLPADPELEVVGDVSEDGGYAAARQLLASDERPTAIFAISDAIAFGALAALREAGVSVPGEIAVAGFGDLPVARFVVPALSSVRVPAFELGRLAIDRMLLAVARRDRPNASHDLLECTVVPRASCGVHESG